MLLPLYGCQGRTCNEDTAYSRFLTYYQIAVGKGITVEDYKDALLEKKNEYIDEQVKAGSITEDQGKIIKERISTNIENCNGQTPGYGRINGACGIGRGFGSTGMGRFGEGRGFGRSVQ